MSREKPERNKIILELKKKGYTYRQIHQELVKKGYRDLKDQNTVKRQYHRLIEAQSKQITKAPSKQVAKVAQSKQRVKAPSKQVYQRATYHLTKEQIRDINILAAKREIQRSALIRQIITKYLSKQSDL